ncbi:chlororespiratory reduction protein 7 [Spirulina sp. CS-785/01]|uniref:chlororespiratory reduction protein 7 n=1 Tax=Spirulina sp. CS-785/01 TaxID=3021716 RepID=UPI00232D4E7D|nr:chlororespiratory reduction protein 7 [Spirulina sp. CS-785/01]MDB9315222.1 chlororespiratory reduction protein 7 [Spirulina sp. CS-785/01]
MSDFIMYQEDGYVVLETNQPEQLVTAPELLDKLKGVLQQQQPDDLPVDIQSLSSLDEQAEYLMEHYCELDLGPGEYLQWYVVRFEK